MKSTNKILKALMLFVALFATSSAFAVNRFYIPETPTFSAAFGINLPIMIECSDEISSGQVDILLPEGLRFSNVTFNKDIYNTHTAQNSVINNADGTQTVRLIFVSYSNEPLNLNGVAEFANLSLYSTSSTDRTEAITFEKVKLMNTANQEVADPTAQNVFYIDITGVEVQMRADKDYYSINPGGTADVVLQMSNNVACYGLQFDVVLPEGLTIVKNTNNELFSKDAAMNVETIVASKEHEGYIRVMVISNKYEEPAVNSNYGTYFKNILKFTVKAADDFAYEGEQAVIDFNNIAFSSWGVNDVAPKSVDVESFTVNFKAGNLALTDANAVVDGLQAKLDAALAQIAENDALVADKFPGTDIQNSINNLKAAIEDAYNNGTLTGNYANVVEAPAAAIEAAIEKLVADADAAQRVAFNDKAYADAKAQIAELQQLLDETVAKIKAEYPAYEDKNEANAIQNSINKASNDALAKYVEVTNAGTYDYAVPYDEIKAAIEQLYADAEGKAGDDARKAYNAEAYAHDMALVDAVKAYWAEMAPQIEEMAPGMNETEGWAAIDAAIAALVDQINANYKYAEENGETYVGPQELQESCDDIRENIDALYAEAAELYRQNYNQQAYMAQWNQLEALMTYWDEMQPQILNLDENMNETDEWKAIDPAIEVLAAAIQDAYEYAQANGELYVGVMELEEKIADVREDIDALYAEAAELYRQNYNQQAYMAQWNQLEALMTYWDEMQPQILELDGGANETDEWKAIDSDIEALAMAIQDAYEYAQANGELYVGVMELEEKIADVRENIDALLLAAAEMNRQLYNQQAYLHQLNMVEELIAYWEAAQTEIKEVNPDSEGSDEWISINEAIEALMSAIQESYEYAQANGELYVGVMELEEKIADVKEDIDALVNDAHMLALQLYNQQAYMAQWNQLEALMDKWMTAQQTIETEAPDLVGGTEWNAIQDAIEALANAINEAYEYAQANNEYYVGVQELEEKIADISEDIDALVEKSGISSVLGDENNIREIMTLDGVRHQKPVVGQVNVIIYKDNTIKKVYVK